MKVDIYRNIGPEFRDLDRKVYSVRSRRSGATYGKVQHHAAYAKADGAQFVVSEAGRLRCVEEGQKNVHGVVRTDALEFMIGEGDWGRYWEWDNLHEQFDPYPREVDFDPQRDIVDQFIRMRKRLRDRTAVRVTYDPYKWTQFVDKDEHRPVMAADRVLFFPQDVVAVGPTFGDFDPRAPETL